MDFDDAYANAAYIPGADGYPPRWQAEAAAFRDGATCEIDVPYGDRARQVMDLFYPGRLPLGVVIFIHGGYWLKFDKSYWSHLARGPVEAGWAVAVPSYDLCPDVRISDITAQMVQMVGQVGDRLAGPIRVTGHSAGGHLSARLASAGLAVPHRDRFARVMPISPLSDLAPLMQTKMNDDLKIDVAEAEAESPVNHPPADVPVTVWVGGAERPAFLDQAGWLAEAWGADHVVDEGRHHFDVIEGLADPEAPITRTLLS